MTNLVTNGVFTTDASGWTATNATLAAVSGGVSGNALQVTNSTTAAGTATQDVTTVVGVAYYVRTGFLKGTSTSGVIQVGTTGTPTSYYNSGALSNTSWLEKFVSFIATTTTTRITLANNTTTSGVTSLFDNVVLEAVIDIAQASAKNRAYRQYQTMLTPVAFNTKKTTANLVRKIPYWLGLTGTAFYNVDLSGTYSGTIVVSSGDVRNTKITILDKASKIVVAMTRPDSTGAFSFTGLDKTTVNGYIAFDEVSGAFNAIIYDRLVIT